MSFQERVPQSILELSLATSQEKHCAFIRSVLISLGIPSADISEQFEKGVYTLKVFDEKGKKLKNIHQLFLKLKLPAVTSQLLVLKPKDWLTRWKLHWRPAHLTRKLDVVPAWYRKQYRCPKGRDYILMDTLLSFGTGLHETTQIVSQYIEDSKGRLTSFLDIGTGTGILALVAIKHGAKEVLGLDIGDLSVQACKDNMKANKIYFDVRKADIKKFRHPKQYDFVAANLITHDLIDNAQKIISFVKPGGLLAVSGISLDNLPKLRKAFSKLPLTCLQVKQGKQWSGVLYERQCK